jgi:predicted nuclease with TOPRIM domain
LEKLGKKEETMNDQLEERLKTLEAEFENGKKMLADLEAREAALRSSMLRISGAIQVLREFVPKTDSVDVPEQTQPSAAVAN